MKISGKSRRNRSGRKRRLEEDLASKEGVNKVPASRGDKPHREKITTETTNHLEIAVLGDSIVNGIIIKNAKIVTCPGAQIHQLSERKIMDEFSRLRIKKNSDSRRDKQHCTERRLNTLARRVQ